LAELTAIRYSFTSSGKMKAESKDEMRKRGLKSPDLADALCLTNGQRCCDCIVWIYVNVEAVTQA